MIDALDAAGVPYMVAGSYSSNAYGVARATQDADLVVMLSGEGLRQLVAKLPAKLRIDPQVSFETITGTTRHVVQVVGGPFKIELFHLGADTYDQERFARRRLERFLGRMSYLQTAEDVVVQKLRWSKDGKRAKDIEDVRNVIAVQSEYLDWGYIHHWCDQHGTRSLLEDVRRSIPKLD